MTIYSRLMGGLGNQLFQYATAYAMAKRADTDLILDIRGLKGKADHITFGLQPFKISAKIGEDQNLPPAREHLVPYTLWRYFGRNPRQFREKGLGLNPSLLTALDNIYLHGYFQTEKYFQEFTDDLRDEFQLSSEPNDVSEAWLSKIRDAQSVSVHIRRGDYLGTGMEHVCDADYYQRGIDRLTAQFGGDLSYFIFSNDLDWVRENLHFDGTAQFVTGNEAAHPSEDLRLMAACNHHIIANSTFSWWGVWLNEKKDKTVIAPKDWFGTYKAENPDLLPESWVTI